MGATIAAQLANVGIETTLLDIVLPELSESDKKKGLTKDSKAFRNKLAQNGLENTLKSKPASFYIPEELLHEALRIDQQAFLHSLDDRPVVHLTSG